MFLQMSHIIHDFLSPTWYPAWFCQQQMRQHLGVWSLKMWFLLKLGVLKDKLGIEVEVNQLYTPLPIHSMEKKKVSQHLS